MFCFHGYDESSESFAFLENHIADEFILIAIDLPFHGKTDWKESLTFTPENLLEIIRHIIDNLALSNSRMVLLGFSMGGRVALSLLQIIPEKIEKVLLMAPDGLKVNSWYRLATQNWLGNKLFRFTMRSPGWLLVILKAGNKLGLANQSIYKFTTHYIQDRQVRDNLYHRWTIMRKFRPVIHTIKSLIIENKITVKLLYGKYDRIVRFERGEKFRKRIEQYCDIIILQDGHQVLDKKNAELIIRLLKG